MSTPVVMPQMGESIAEGTIVRWIKKVGDAVDRDEPLFEISTDKVDAEIPAPAAGVLTEIKVKEGETVPVNAVVATIGEASEVVTSKAPAQAPVQADGEGPPQKKVPATPKPNGREAAAMVSRESAVPAAVGHEDVRRQKSSPLVRRIAKEHNVDVSQIHGSGLGGRVTKHDILGHLETGTRESGSGIREFRVRRFRPDRTRRLRIRHPDPRAGIPIPDPGSAIASRSSRCR